MSDLQVCIPQLLPFEKLEEAQRLAIAENPRNEPRPGTIAGIPSKFWLPGRTLRCRFLDGVVAVQDRVAEIAERWSDFANIAFDFGEHPDAEIRISFSRKGSWSYIGTDALTIAPNEPTMNYGWLKESSSDATYERVVLHEFGHALGFIHEHQHPEAGFEWDRDAVLEYYTGPPNNWSVSKTERNVLNRYDKTMTQFTDFDPHSIMLYPVPKEHTVGDFEVTWRNRELSGNDQAFAARVYPREISAFDAAVLAPNGKLYLFRGSQYVRLSPGGAVDDGYPKPIKGNWGGMPDAFTSNLDAVALVEGKMLFFKGSEYVSYTPGVGVDDGFPRPILEGFPTVRF